MESRGGGGVFIESLNVIFYKPDIAVKLYKCHDFK